MGFIDHITGNTGGYYRSPKQPDSYFDDAQGTVWQQIETQRAFRELNESKAGRATVGLTTEVDSGSSERRPILVNDNINTPTDLPESNHRFDGQS